MAACDECGGTIQRVRRKFLFDRILYRAVYKCKKCGQRKLIPKPWSLVVSGPDCCCPLCGTCEVTRLRKPDRIDRFYNHPLSIIHRVFGASLYHCSFCRIQFYDSRKWASRSARAEAARSANA